MQAHTYVSVRCQQPRAASAPEGMQTNKSINQSILLLSLLFFIFDIISDVMDIASNCPFFHTNRARGSHYGVSRSRRYLAFLDPTTWMDHLTLPTKGEKIKSLFQIFFQEIFRKKNPFLCVCKICAYLMSRYVSVP